MKESELRPRFDVGYCREECEGRGRAHRNFRRLIGDIGVENGGVLTNLKGRRVYVAPHLSHLDEFGVMVALYSVLGDPYELPITLAHRNPMFRLLNCTGLFDKFGVVSVKDNRKPVVMKRLVDGVLEEADLLFFPTDGRNVRGRIRFKPLLFSSILAYAQKQDVSIVPVRIDYNPVPLEEACLYLGPFKRLEEQGGVKTKVAEVALTLMDFFCFSGAFLFKRRRGMLVSFRQPIHVKDFGAKDARKLAEMAQEASFS